MLFGFRPSIKQARALRAMRSLLPPGLLSWEDLVPESPTSGDSFVILSWNRVEEATEYRIYRNKGGSTPDQS